LQVARHLQYIDEAFVGLHIFRADPHNYAIHRFCAEYADAKVCRLRRRRMWDVVVVLTELEECSSRGQRSDSGGGLQTTSGRCCTLTLTCAALVVVVLLPGRLDPWTDVAGQR
jgi:hypothetical protein